MSNQLVNNSKMEISKRTIRFQFDLGDPLDSQIHNHYLELVASGNIHSYVREAMKFYYMTSNSKLQQNSKSDEAKNG